MHILFIFGLVIGLLASCQQQTATPGPLSQNEEGFVFPPTWTTAPETQERYTATPRPAASPAATWTPEPSTTLPASLTPLPTWDPNATTESFCYQSADACEISVKNALRWGYCQMVSLEKSCGLIYDYTLRFPQGWVIDTVGAQRPNLLFNTGTGNSEVRLFQLPAGTLSLENADLAALCNAEGDCVPIVSADESILRRRERVYAGRNFLFLTSSQADHFITRYFLFLEHRPGDVRLYILEIRLPSILADSEEYTLLLDQTQIMLGSIQPDTRFETTLVPPTQTSAPTPTFTETPTVTPTVPFTTTATTNP
jgi:hypothetical protein